MEGEDTVQARPEIHLVPVLPQEQSTFLNMQKNHQPDSERRRFSNSPWLSCTQLLAQADTNGAASIPSYAADSQISSYAADSCDKAKADVLLTPQKFICDLNHTPEEMVRTRLQKNKPEWSPISLDTPGKKLPQHHETSKKSLPETGSPAAGEKERKRARDDDDDKAKLKTPQQTQKRKKIRGKVAGDGYTNKTASKSAIKKASSTAPATATPASAKTTPEANSIYVRPKRSCKRSLTFNSDVEEEEEEEEYCGLTFTSDGRIGICSGGKIVQLLDNISKRRHQSWTRSKTTIDQSVTGRESLSMTENKFLIRFPNIQRKRRSSIVTKPHNLLSEMKPSVFRKKRSNRDAIASKLNARVLHLKWRRHSATGPSDEELWERKLSIDSVTELLKELDITRENSCLPHSRETALVLHEETCKKQKAMYMKDGSIIPYPDEKKYQTKVQLDEESTRVWKLLMVSIDSEGVDGLDEDKQKWWEEERKMFHERANTFISRMRLVQGDRRFSPWKGSVVDSVVGVFLTQNVADHSSSSAFMDIAAEFPVIFNSIKGSCHKELGSSVTGENLDSANAVATPRTHKQTCFVIDEIDDDGIDAVCSQESSKSSDSSICSTNQSEKMLLDPPTNSFEADYQQGISMNLNEIPIEVESCDEFRNNVDEGSQKQEQQSNTTQSQDEESKTRTDQHTNTKNKKKPAKKSKPKRKAKKSKPNESFDWDSLRRQAESSGRKRERTERTMDAVDWDALRCTNVNKIADLIRKRGMHDMLSHRIKDFLNRMVQDHGDIDLEWLRDVPPDKAKEYLLSINGLGLKSVECVRLLSLHQTAFPVDTNVGRIAVRLGWVPLQPLPDELQMHLLDLYPVLESVQKYLWPRLCKLDQKTLYELHYHMITFGKVFCTKKKPNCKACPMKAECRHYASARASAQLALPDAEEAVTIHKRRPKPEPVVVVNFQQTLFLTRDKEQDEGQSSRGCEPIIEEPATPEPPECPDIEDCHWNNEDEISTDPWENKDVIPTIILGIKKNGISTIFEARTSNDLVVVSNQTTSIPRHKLKNKENLRTEHLVYELPDSHPILRGFKRRDPDDTFSYLFAIWTPGETANSIQLPKQRCVSQEGDILCHEKTCFPCNNRREVNSQKVRGTILIPCRTAMGGRFPLNGTYFQTNEVFADHGSSVKPIYVPRESIGSLRRAIVYFGSSASACFGGLSVEAIQYGFWTGYVCIRGFDRKTRKSKALVKRLHSPPSKKKETDYE